MTITEKIIECVTNATELTKQPLAHGVGTSHALQTKFIDYESEFIQLVDSDSFEKLTVQNPNFNPSKNNVDDNLVGWDELKTEISNLTISNWYNTDRLPTKKDGTFNIFIRYN